MPTRPTANQASAATWVRRTCAGTLAVATIGTLGMGCLTRPVVASEPTTKTNFTAAVKQKAVDKIDLLFTIDNSASMGDKQDYLKAAIPDLVKRLVQPNCLDAQGVFVGSADASGQCANGAKLEFPAVHDMHIGIISTSLGQRLGDVCKPDDKSTVTGLNAHADDRGELLNRATDDEHAVTELQPSRFLSWFPDVPANTVKTPSSGATPIKNSDTLVKDFQDLVSGVHQYGCGIESQLESWYRFLVQPDPYDHLEQQGSTAAWVGVDDVIIRQRHDFLRPDSLLAIIVLTDENDSEVDVRTVGGQAFQFMSTQFQPPRGTSVCDQNPNDPKCTSCAFADAQTQANDPNCKLGPYSARNDWGYDLNLRHVHNKQKYGVDTQFPITRYSLGLTSTLVPDRTGEYPTDAASGKASTYYVGNANCTNPIFAASLPESAADPNALCHMAPGTRSKDLVFYAIIGGVPSQLLHFDPKLDSNSLSPDDWTKILGKDPEHLDYTGIDPHMIESFSPRPGLPPPTAASTADPIHGREWITDQGNHADLQVDRQYACTFPLAQPRDCTQAANTPSCDCSSVGLAAGQLSPVCDPANPTTQVKAKAYPTVRELLVAKLLGDQGIVSSICPIHVQEQGSGDPLYGYRPAAKAIVDRLKNALSSQCLPQRLTPDATGVVPCLILETLPDQGDESVCAKYPGLSQPDPLILTKFREQQKTSFIAAGGAKSGPDPSLYPVCEVKQILAAAGQSCATSQDPGWCYIESANGQNPAGNCSQAIVFSASGNPPSGASVSLQCVESKGASDAGK